MEFVLSIEEDNLEGGFYASLGNEGEKANVIADIYGDTAAEAAMTAIYNAVQEEKDSDLNGWRHEG